MLPSLYEFYHWVNTIKDGEQQHFIKLIHLINENKMLDLQISPFPNYHEWLLTL